MSKIKNLSFPETQVHRDKERHKNSNIIIILVFSSAGWLALLREPAVFG
jgi:hypothetical protein